jgi:hypothetical protein
VVLGSALVASHPQPSSDSGREPAYRARAAPRAREARVRFGVPVGLVWASDLARGGARYWARPGTGRPLVDRRSVNLLERGEYCGDVRVDRQPIS